MRKYIVGLIIILVCVFLLEWRGIIDIPYVDLPGLNVAKQEMETQKDVIYYKIN